MNYFIDIEYWKHILEQRAFKIEEEEYYVHGHPTYSGIFLVFNLNLQWDETFGIGPINMAFAKYDYDTNKWSSFYYPKEDNFFYDFRDECNHNVGGHDGKITHWLDSHELNSLIIQLLCDVKKERDLKKS